MPQESPPKLKIPFVVYGAGGHGKVVLDIAHRAQVAIDWLIDDNVQDGEVDGFTVTSAARLDWTRLGRFEFLVAIGDNGARERVFAELQRRGGKARSLVHPFSSISSTAHIAYGVSVCAGAVISPGAVVGADCIVNTCASIDHDCKIGEHVHICPGARLAGSVEVGAGTLVGTGASVLPGIHIGSRCKVGAGAVVNRDLPDRVIAFGVPVRVKPEMPTR